MTPYGTVGFYGRGQGAGGSPKPWPPGAVTRAGNTQRGQGLRVKDWLFLSACLMLFYFPTLSLVPFYTKGEPREAVAVQLLWQGDGKNWILPRRPSGHGLEVASKPPLFHWLAFLASLPHGRVTEFAARLPSALLACAAVFATAFVGSVTLGRSAGLYGALILTSNVEWLRAATTARVDMTVTALLTLSLFLLYRCWVERFIGGWRFFLACALMGVAVLAKGPIGIILPTGVLFAALVLGRKPALAPLPHLAAGLLLACAMGGAWYLVAAIVGGEEFVRKQILKENVFRFFSRADALGAGHQHPFYYFLPAMAGGFAPWSLCLVPVARDLVKGRLAWREPRIFFLLCWFAFVFLFYSASASKRSVYLLPLYPAAGLLVGHWWSSLSDPATAAPGRAARLVRALGVVLATLFLFPLAILICERFGFGVSEWIRPLLHHKDQANLPLVRDFIMANFPLATGWAILCGACAFYLGRAFAEAAWRRVFGLTLVATAATFLMAFHVFQPPLATGRSLKTFVASAKRRAEQSGLPLCRLETTFDYAVEFYFGRPLPICASAAVATGEPKGVASGGAGGKWLVLLWDRDLDRLSAPTSGALEVLETSEGTDPSGRKHLMLALADRGAP